MRLRQKQKIYVFYVKISSDRFLWEGIAKRRGRKYGA